MRTSVNLPPAVRRRVQELAATSGRSLSVTIADLTVRGLATLQGEEVAVDIDERTGLPVMSIGRPVTNEDVARILDEE